MKSNKFIVKWRRSKRFIIIMKYIFLSHINLNQRIGMMYDESEVQPYALRGRNVSEFTIITDLFHDIEHEKMRVTFISSK